MLIYFGLTGGTPQPSVKPKSEALDQQSGKNSPMYVLYTYTCAIFCAFQLLVCIIIVVNKHIFSSDEVFLHLYTAEFGDKQVIMTHYTSVCIIVKNLARF